MTGVAAQHYAGFGRRLLAALIDSVIFSIFSVSMFYLLYGPSYFQQTAAGEALANSVAFMELLIDWVLPCLITVFFWLRLSATPGKLLMACQVVDARTGDPLALRQALLRYVGYFVSLLPLGMGFLWILWDKRNQGFHDKIAQTVVVLEDESCMTLVKLERELGASDLT